MSSNAGLSASFITLPTELRQKIWLATFEPRTLSLSMREYNAPIDSANTNLWIQTFDIQLGLRVDQLSDDEARSSHSLNPQFFYKDRGIFKDAMRIKPPPGPVALEVCRESREVALQHYELMFQGSLLNRRISKDLDEAFDASGWGLPRTWVNPKLDLIFLSCMSRSLDSQFAPVDAQMFFYRCRSEATKVQKLGVMSHNNHGHPLLMIRKCTALKELVVYLTHREHPYHRSDEELEILDEEMAAKEIEDFLVSQKKEHNDYLPDPGCLSFDGPWKARIPKVRVSRELRWRRLDDGKLSLRLVPPTQCHPQLFRSP